MRHPQADSALPQESHKSPSREEEEEEEEAAEAASHLWKPRTRGVLMGHNPPELTCQKVYQVSIFSPPASCSHLSEQRAPGRQPVKRNCPEPLRVAEGEWDAKRDCWETGDNAIEDGLLVDALALGGAAQHFSHSGLRVVEHRQDSHANGHRRHDGCSSSTAPVTPQHTPCNVLHTKDCTWDAPPASDPLRRSEEEEGGLPQDKGVGLGTSCHPIRLDPELHDLARPLAPGERLSLRTAGLGEPGTPEGPEGPGSAEKTPCSGLRLPASGTGSCRAKRKLLPSVEPAVAPDPGSEDETLPPARKKRALLLHPAVPASCRSTDAKGAPFWNHLLPAAKDSANSSSRGLHGQLKTGLRALKPRPFRKSLVEGRRPPSPWAKTTSTSRALLGSFEESMLKGRFPPSGQIEGFTAEIGASGSYCPQHATLPVEVTYFDIAEHGGPSPFLGVIDLETLGKKGYSIPKSGTLQVTLFNPNKTVVKMFLVTYDFRDMPANHVTFLRHRIFLVPVGEEEQEVPGQPPRRVLCYLMHLRFHSSKSGKIYLHDNIRLLFSRKSIEVDSGIPYELKSFTELPRNPCYSPRA